MCFNLWRHEIFYFNFFETPITIKKSLIQKVATYTLDFNLLEKKTEQLKKCTIFRKFETCVPI